MKTGICGKGGQRVPVGTGQGHVRVGAMTVGTRTTEACRLFRAREAEHERAERDRAARGRGGARRRRRRGRGLRLARERPRGPGPRRRGREPHRGDPDRDRRPRLDRRTGSATPTAPTSARPASRRSPPAPPRPPRVADEDEFAAPPGAGARSSRSPGSATPRSPTWSADQVADARARRSSAAALAADPRVAGVEQAVYADSAELVAIASSTGVAGEYESSELLRLPAGAGRGRGRPRDRARLRPRPRARRASTRRRSAPRAASARWR